MEIIKQQWFWISLFSLISVIIGSTLTIVANYWKEKSNRKTQIKIEKMKMYDEKKFHAYLDLYEFLSVAFSMYWPPDYPKQDFISVMKKHFFTKVKIHYPYLKKEIREKIRILESQYDSLGDPELIPNIPVDQFFNTDYLKILNELNETVEKIFDKWENN
jgi:hypothetical protein